jgi:hypothetical protein
MVDTGCFDHERGLFHGVGFGDDCLMVEAAYFDLDAKSFPGDDCSMVEASYLGLDAKSFLELGPGTDYSMVGIYYYHSVNWKVDHDSTSFLASLDTSK